MEARSARRLPPALLSVFIFLAAGTALLLFPGPVTESVKQSVLYCLTGLVPSLFPFMVLTCYAAESGAAEQIGRFLGFLPRYVFRLPEVCAAPILLSFLGGYPAGAGSVSLLLEQGLLTEAQAARMMRFCVAPGAAFVVTYLGGSVLGSYRAGWVLFFSVTLTGLLLGFLTGLKTPVPPRKKPESHKLSGNALIRSVSGASRSVVTMCGCIVLFAGVSAVLRCSGLSVLLSCGLARVSPFSVRESSALLAFLLEVTGGVGSACEFQVSAGFFAFGLAFGGLCVHQQLFSLFRQFPGRKSGFFLFRLLHGLLAAGLAAVLVRWLPGSPVEAMAPGSAAGAPALSGTPAGGLSLLLLCTVFLLISGPRTPPAEWSSTRRRRSDRRSAGKRAG